MSIGGAAPREQRAIQHFAEAAPRARTTHNDLIHLITLPFAQMLAASTSAMDKPESLKAWLHPR
jgi:hypothetical protein